METFPEHRLLFLSLDYHRSKDPKIPLAMASIQAHFEHQPCPQGLRARFESIHLNTCPDIVASVDALLDAEPITILAIGVYIWNEQVVQHILRRYAQGPRPIIILGGPQITFERHSLPMRYPQTDFFVRGEAEVAFFELIQTIVTHGPFGLESLPRGVTDVMQAGGSYPTAQVALEDLPSPYLSSAVPLEMDQAFLRWETSRGCPYQCNFCQFKDGHGKVKRFEHDRIFLELALFHAKRVKQIAVLDPIFNIRKAHFLPILEEISRLGMQAHFSFQARLELLERPEGLEFLAFCREYKNVTLEFGVQTFNEAESKATQRNNQMDKVMRGIELLHEYGIDFDLHLIFGLPLQDLDSFVESYEAARLARPSRLFIFPLNVLKGTEIMDRAEEYGYQWDASQYNLFTASKWMDQGTVDELKLFAEENNHRAKAQTFGGRQTLTPLRYRAAQ